MHGVLAEFNARMGGRAGLRFITQHTGVCKPKHARVQRQIWLSPPVMQMQPGMPGQQPMPPQMMMAGMPGQAPVRGVSLPLHGLHGPYSRTILAVVN